jgi:hypothetical protein
MKAIPVPVPGLSLVIDYILITDTISSYKSQLGLDDESLRKLAKRYNLSLDEIDAKLTGGWMGSLLKNNIKEFVFELFKQKISKKIVEESVQFIPLIGSAMRGVETARITMITLNKSLDELSNAAVSIINLIQ